MKERHVFNWMQCEPDQGVELLRTTFGFDFCTVGLAPGPAAPLKWVHTSGAGNPACERIVLSPGRGVGGIVLKIGLPMLFTDIDAQLDPREYAGYPIVFAENLHSFCALPLSRGPEVCGVLLCGFRSVPADQDVRYLRLFASIAGGFCGFAVSYEGLVDVLAAPDEADRFAKPIVGDVFDDEEEAQVGARGGVDPYKALSNRELEVFALLARGFTNREIANRLFVSVKTVESHRSAIYRKLGIETRAQLVYLAIRHQLLA